jgi:hypothetical protein
MPAPTPEPASGQVRAFPQAWMWLQLIVGWLPMWGLFTAMIFVVHGTSLSFAALNALRMILAGALLGLIVYRFTARMPWPYPFRMSFVGIHLLAAVVYAACWLGLYSLIESLVRWHLVMVVGPGIELFMITGVWLYVMVAGVAYANRAAQRSARIEADAARAQLAALRAQLHPHFLFNALHTVVQLVPIDPRLAVHAAEQLAGLLRTSLEEARDRVTLEQEWTFVERYLAIEHLRFGERLQYEVRIDPDARAARLPSFALQTLVENAIRHSATPRVEATRLTISARVDHGVLTLGVHDDGRTADLAKIAASSGTGLRRLRERLSWLYGDQASLGLAADEQGFSATLVVPQAGDRTAPALPPEADDD